MPAVVEPAMGWRWTPPPSMKREPTTTLPLVVASYGMPSSASSRKAPVVPLVQRMMVVPSQSKRVDPSPLTTHEGPDKLPAPLGPRSCTGALLPVHLSSRPALSAPQITFPLSLIANAQVSVEALNDGSAVTPLLELQRAA